MARIGKLTAIEVTKAKGPAVLHDGGGLYLRVSGSGAKSWVFRYQLDGKRRDMGLGPYPDVSLADARARAGEHRKLRLDGVDPLEARTADRYAQRVAEAKGRTFREVAEELLRQKEAGWRNAAHREQSRNTLATYVYPVLGELPVAAIDTGLVMQALTPIWATKTETAKRVRGRIEAVLDAATVHGYREGPNPASWRGHLDELLPAPGKLRVVEHHPALPYAEVPAFMADLRAHTGVSARALEFAILTAARSGEALGATWSEIDLVSRTWTIPAARMKALREHRIPLSDAALAVIGKIREFALTVDGSPEKGAPVFPGLRRAVPLSRMVLLKLLWRLGHREVTVHGFRSSFSDWAAERTNYPREVVEMALAHAIENPVEAAYRRGDLFEKRRQLMDAWAQFCAAPATTGEVVPLHAAR
jgi:integrase